MIYVNNFVEISEELRFYLCFKYFYIGCKFDIFMGLINIGFFYVRKGFY